MGFISVYMDNKCDSYITSIVSIAYVNTCQDIVKLCDHLTLHETEGHYIPGHYSMYTLFT